MIQEFRGGKFENRERLNQMIRQINKNSAMQGDEFIGIDNSPMGKNVKLKLNQLLPRLMRVSGIRRAYSQDDAQIGTTAQFYLDTDETGESIDVECDIAGGEDLNAAIPRLEIGTPLHIWKDGDTWRSIMTFQATQDCE